LTSVAGRPHSIPTPAARDFRTLVRDPLGLTWPLVRQERAESLREFPPYPVTRRGRRHGSCDSLCSPSGMARGRSTSGGCEIGTRLRQLTSTKPVAVLAAGLLLFVVSCSGGPRTQGAPGEPGPDRDGIVRFAKTFVGTPYRSGGTTYKGVDCSGFVFAVYREFDVPLPRSSLDQSHTGVPIDRSDLEPADLVFFKTSKRASVTHVGIYVGGGKFIHASTSSRKVRVDALSDDYYRNKFTVARRVVTR